jgi:hypothetical protein
VEQAEQQLASFIAKFTPEIAALTRSILAAMRVRYPTAIELVYDNYNALAIGFGPSEKTSQACFSCKRNSCLTRRESYRGVGTSPVTSVCRQRAGSMNCQ